MLLGMATVGVFGCSNDDEAVPATTQSTSVSTPPATASPTPSPIPMVSAPTAAAVETMGWETYIDDALGFSLKHADDLEASVIASGADSGDRVVVFRSGKNPDRGFAVAISPNTEGLNIREYAAQYTSCLQDTINEQTVSGQAAISCSAPATETPASAVLFEYNGRFFYITSTIEGQEFEGIVNAFELESSQ